MDCCQSGSSVHGDSPDKNTWAGCHALLQGIFPSQGSNPGLPHCRQVLYHLSHQKAQEFWIGMPIFSSGGFSRPRNWTGVSCIAGRFFPSLATRQAHNSISVQFSSVSQLCPTLCDPMNLSTPGLPVHHQLPNACLWSWWCHPTISSSVIPFSSCPQSFPASGFFPMTQFFTLHGQSIGVSASASVLPMNTRDWFPCSPSDFQGFSPTPQFKSINSSVLSFLHRPTLTSIHDHWKNHSFDWTDLCWQSNVYAF